MNPEQTLLENWRSLDLEKQQQVLEYISSLKQDVSQVPQTENYQPKTALGKKLWQLRLKSLGTQPRLNTWEDVEQELISRRGGLFLVKAIKTYIDSGVLITLFRGRHELAIKAATILDDPNRVFASSIFVKLEVLSKPIYHKQQDEVECYTSFFEACQFWATDLENIVQLAQDLAKQYGLSALDALQIACAISLNADEFVTTEKTTKPLHRVSEIVTLSIAN